MFDFGFFELLLLSLVGLIVVGPERLPTFVRTVGLWVGRARAVVASVRTEFEREVNDAGLHETERRVREEVHRAGEGVAGNDARGTDGESSHENAPAMGDGEARGAADEDAARGTDAGGPR